MDATNAILVGRYSFWTLRASDEDKQGMARSLFEYVAYDLETQRIADFRLKPWAERYLVLRMALYEEGMTGNTEALETKKPDDLAGFKSATVLCP